MLKRLRRAALWAAAAGVGGGGIAVRERPIQSRKIAGKLRENCGEIVQTCGKITGGHTQGTHTHGGWTHKIADLNPPPCDIPSGCCSFTGPWTVTRSSLRILRRVAAFCRPLRPVLLLVSFPRSRSPVVGVQGLC